LDPCDHAAFQSFPNLRIGRRILGAREDDSGKERNNHNQRTHAYQ
jgi:hypothetical protein